jgi:hypothetical protein
LTFFVSCKTRKHPIDLYPYIIAPFTNYPANQEKEESMASFNKLPTRQLGKNGPQIPRLGLGLMGISGIYGMPAPDAERLAFLDEVYKKRETFWDTG